MTSTPGNFPPGIDVICAFVRRADYDLARKNRLNSAGQISRDTHQKRLEAGPVGVSEVTRGLLDDLFEKIEAGTPEEVEEPRRDTSEGADWRKRKFKRG